MHGSRKIDDPKFIIMELVQLVDEQDNEIGVMEKLSAHREAKLHRAISIFIFNEDGALLLQRRAGTKYHSALLWTNTCCTHPRPKENLLDAANRRLREEMGMSAELKFCFSFVYKAALENGLTEYEFDHVYFGRSNQLPVPNNEEVEEWRYVNLTEIEEELAQHPELFTEWFKLIFDRVKELRK